MTGLLVFLIVTTVFLSLWGLLSFLTPRSNPLERMENWLEDSAEPEKTEVVRKERNWINILGSKAELLGFGKKYSDKTRLFLVRADIPLTGYEFNMVRGVFSIGVAALFFLITRNMLLLVVVGAITWNVPMVYIKALIVKRYRMFGDQLGDALSILANSLRAGFSFLQAVNSVAREMPDPIAKEFKTLLKEMSLGMSMETSLQNLLTRVEMDDLELLVTAILIQKEVGGNLSEVLDNIGNTIRERVRIKNEIKTLTAQGRMSGWVVGLLPIALAVFLYFSNPKYMKVLFIHPVGWIMLGYGIISELIGFFVIGKIVKIEV